jgi:sialic acid synthase
MKRSFELVKGRWIGEGYPCFIIAEIGQNHQGDVNIAKELIKMAKDCGADCVKFQKSDLPIKFTKSVLERAYDSPHAFGHSYGDHKRFLEFSPDEYRELMTYATSLNIPFSASAMDESSLDFLVKLGVPFIKIGSGDANNFLLLEKAAKTQLPVIYSTGK